ncbi:MAG: hypothetical protein JW959_02545 [Pirellulales bacterium]|nr:hypothetical protein [Pirellulales bacterium]
MKPHRKRRRRGTVLVLTAVMMVAMFALVAMAVDLGYVTLVRTQLQSAADAAALAATWELYEARAFNLQNTPEQIQSNALEKARYYARRNPVGGIEPELADADVTFGRLDPADGPDAALDTTDPSTFNAVRVRVRRSDEINGEVPSFFARVIGVDSTPNAAQATAVFLDNFSGVVSPPLEKGNVKMLPFAMDRQTWLEMLDGPADDQWSWDEQSGEIAPGPDGVPEGNLFPQDTGSPGNRGTVDIGADNNSTADLRRQIVDGVNASDLDHIGGKLELGPDGYVELNGDTGISAGMKSELASIRGQPRIVPLFDSVSGPGNRAMYKIVGFAGVRVMEVKLTGNMSGKRVIVQPARVQIYGGIPAPGGTTASYYLYSPVWLVR